MRQLYERFLPHITKVKDKTTAIDLTKLKIKPTVVAKDNKKTERASNIKSNSRHTRRLLNIQLENKLFDLFDKSIIKY